MQAEIIKIFFLIIVFSLYGFISLITFCRFLSKKDGDQNKLIEMILNDSSDEESERPNLNIKTDKNEMEIELEDFKDNGSIEDKINLNKTNSLEEEKNDSKLSFKIFVNTINSLIKIEMGEKIQIFNMALVSRYKNSIHIIFGNLLAVFIINFISIVYGLKILQKKINYIFLIIEGILYLNIGFYYIYFYILKN